MDPLCARHYEEKLSRPCDRKNTAADPPSGFVRHAERSNGDRAPREGCDQESEFDHTSQSHPKVRVDVAGCMITDCRDQCSKARKRYRDLDVGQQSLVIVHSGAT